MAFAHLRIQGEGCRRNVPFALYALFHWSCHVRNFPQSRVSSPDVWNRVAPACYVTESCLFALVIISANTTHFQDLITASQGAQRLNRRLNHICVITGAT